MRRVACLICAIGLLICCGPKQPEVERIIEDGVEVVINHLEPYEIKGEPSNLVLEEELRIDFESEEYADLGFAQPKEVDADSEGNVYLYDGDRPSEFFIVKFDREGNFKKEIGRKGQGPGEIQSLVHMRVNAKDEIIITDYGNKKIVAYDKNGDSLWEKKYEPRWTSVVYLDNGNFLATYSERTESTFKRKLAVYNSEFKEVNELDSLDLTDILKGSKRPFGTLLHYWRTKNGLIYVGNQQRDYEILVFNLNGELIRKIRKEYTAIEYPERFRLAVEKMAERRPEIYPLEFNPPFNSFFIDDTSRLYVMTYEQGESSEEYIHDIFNDEGLFVSRQKFGMTYMMGQALNNLKANARYDRYYQLRYKEELGYAELIVYKMIWQ